MSINTGKQLVNLKELRENFPEYIEKVSRGESFTVIKRSKPIFQIGPVTDEGNWTTIVDFTEVDSKGIPIEEVLKAL